MTVGHLPNKPRCACGDRGSRARSEPEFNTDLLDDPVRALLWFNGSTTKIGGHAAWKSRPWDALDRRHAGGLISEPRRKSYSVAHEEKACAPGEAAFAQEFGTPAPVAAAETTAPSAKTAV